MPANSQRQKGTDHPLGFVDGARSIELVSSFDLCRTKDVTFRFEVELAATISEGQLRISFADAHGLVLFTQYLPLEERAPGRITIVLTFPSLPLSEGSYNISCTISSGGSSLAIRGTPELTVLAGRSIAPSAAVRLRKMTGDVRLEGVRSK